MGEQPEVLQNLAESATEQATEAGMNQVNIKAEAGSFGLGSMGSMSGSMTDSRLTSTGIGMATGANSNTKKSKTILTPHLETVTYGSILIVLDNKEKSHPID